MSWIGSEPFIQLLAALGLVNGTTGKLTPVKNIVVKTADYALDGTDGSGTMFTTTGATGAVKFTLPAPSALLKGFEYGFRNTVDQNMTVAGKTAGDVVTFNNGSAASVAASTTSQKIGAHIRAVCDGSKWQVEGTTVGVTFTVA